MAKITDDDLNNLTHEVADLIEQQTKVTVDRYRVNDMLTAFIADLEGQPKSMTFDEVVAKLVKNLKMISYTEFVSVYNDVLGMDGAEGKPIDAVYDDAGPGETTFIEVDDGQ